ncbi:hypothetical protein EJB05_34997 [Eragrostis curvula]|uniref:DUF6598 domain-containing protein n=1 Tax=Eragrostis curvula TaxID=38414 RepID=A0A5J9U5D7_9POAL|nr:hypothetical protein EJB05_34997 [Eragrostis curvula]
MALVIGGISPNLADRQKILRSPLAEPKRKRKLDFHSDISSEHKAAKILEIYHPHLVISNPDDSNATKLFDLDTATIGGEKVDGDMAVGKDSLPLSVLDPELRMKHNGDPNMELTWEEKAVIVLVICHKHLARSYPEAQPVIPSNFFSKMKDSKVGLGPSLSELGPSGREKLESSINVVSLRIIESDLNYPINVFGSVLARDEVDYKCTYLFQRDKADPQIITSPSDRLILTGPKRGLAVTGVMFFEINLKIRCDVSGDRILSKGVLEHHTLFHTKKTIRQLLTSWLSTVELVYSRVPHALEATIMVTVLKGPFEFCGKITAWTSGNEDNHIILFDSGNSATRKATREDGRAFVSPVISVSWDEKLVLRISAECEVTVLTLGHHSSKATCNIGCYELLVEVSWTGNAFSRRKNVFKKLGNTLVLV